jgi:beta-1,4-mannosyltransferase
MSRRSSGRTSCLTVAMWPDPATTGNPYLSRLCAGLAADGVEVVPLGRRSLRRADLLHLQWPDLIISRPGAWQAARASAILLLLVAAARLTGRPTVWTVHNLAPHEVAHPRLESVFWWLFVRLIGGYLTLTRAGISQIEQAHPGLAGKPHAVVPHGTYRGSYPCWPDGTQQARAARGLPAAGRGLLFVGQVRPYKGLPALLSAFAGVADRDAFLAVAGECRDASLASVLRAAAVSDPRVRLELARVPDTELHSWFVATSGTVLPFRAGFNSGSVFLSLTFGRPVLVPDTPVFAELATQVGPAWVTRYRGELSADLLDRFLADSAELVATGAEPELAAFEWPALAGQTVAFYRDRVRAARWWSRAAGTA